MSGVMASVCSWDVQHMVCVLLWCSDHILPTPQRRKESVVDPDIKMLAANIDDHCHFHC